MYIKTYAHRYKNNFTHTHTHAHTHTHIYIYIYIYIYWSCVKIKEIDTSCNSCAILISTLSFPMLPYTGQWQQPDFLDNGSDAILFTAVPDIFQWPIKLMTSRIWSRKLSHCLLPGNHRCFSTKVCAAHCPIWSNYFPQRRLCHILLV